MYVIIVIHAFSNLQQDYHSSINCCILQQPCRCWPSWFNDGILWFSSFIIKFRYHVFFNLNLVCDDTIVCVQYYLKARFHFDKNHFADLMIISGIAGTVSQVIFVRLDFSCPISTMFSLPFFLVKSSISLSL